MPTLRHFAPGHDVGLALLPRPRIAPRRRDQEAERREPEPPIVRYIPCTSAARTTPLAKRAGRRGHAAVGRASATLTLRGEIGPKAEGYRWWEISAWLREQSAVAGAHLQIVFTECAGGRVHDAELAFSSIRAAATRNPVTISTRAERWVGSAAIDLFIAGDWRTAHPLARFKFHGTTYPAGSGWRDLDVLRESDRRCIERLAERTGTSEAMWQEIMRGERIVKAFEAKRLGLVHEVSR